MASLFRAPTARMLSGTTPRSMIRRVATPMLRPAMSARMGVVPRVGVAAFHITKKMQILPAGPQIIEGDVNTPAPVPDPNPVHGSYHWSFERIVSAALIPLTVAPFAAGSLNPITDAILAASVVIHSHIGFESCIIDYFPKSKMPGVHKFMRWFLNGCTALVLLGLYEFETNDVGLTEAIKRIWKA